MALGGISTISDPMMRRCTSEPPVRHSFGSGSRVFGFQDLCVDAGDHPRRRFRFADDMQQSPTVNDRDRIAAQVGDIQKVSHKKQVLYGPAVGQGQPLMSATARLKLGPWGLPGSELGRSETRAERHHYFEQSVKADRWAVLMDRPRKGIGSCQVWQEEAEEKPSLADLAVENDMPADVQVLLCDLKRDVEYTCAQRLGRSALKQLKALRLAEELAPKPSMKFADDLSASLREAIKKGPSPGSSGASTASGDAEVTPSSPDVISVTPGSTPPESTPREWCAESEAGVFHIVNDPKGKQHLSMSTDREQAHSQAVHLPLGFRRAMSAALPAGSDLKLSLGQVRQLNSLCGVMETLRSESKPSKPKQRNPLRSGKCASAGSKSHPPAASWM